MITKSEAKEIRTVLANKLGVTEDKLYIFIYLSIASISPSGAVELKDVNYMLGKQDGDIIKRFMSDPGLDQEADEALAKALSNRDNEQELFDIAFGLSFGRLLKISISKIVQKYTRPGTDGADDKEEMVCEIRKRLLEVLPMYDPSKARMNTYCQRYIIEVATDYVKKVTGMTDNQANLMKHYIKYRDQLIQAGISEPTVKQIAAAAKADGKPEINEYRLGKALESKYDEVPLMISVDNGDDETVVRQEAEMVHSSRFETPEESVINQEMKEAIWTAINSLKAPHEREIMYHVMEYFEDTDSNDLSQSEALKIGRKFYDRSIPDTEVKRSVFAIMRSLSRRILLKNNGRSHEYRPTNRKIFFVEPYADLETEATIVTESLKEASQEQFCAIFDFDLDD